MRIEELPRYRAYVVTDDDDRASPKLVRHKDGEAVLLKDLPQQILVTLELPDPESHETVAIYFKDGGHTFAYYVGEPPHWNVLGHGPLDEGEEEVVAWRRLLV